MPGNGKSIKGGLLSWQVRWQRKGQVLRVPLREVYNRDPYNSGSFCREGRERDGKFWPDLSFCCCEKRELST